MAKKVLILGSLAYDQIMSYEGELRDVAAENHGSMFFSATQRKRAFGGCAGNVAYNMRMMGIAPILASSVGSDFGPYRAHLEGLGIDLAGVFEDEDALTAAGFIMTDRKQEQIAIFDTGAMWSSDYMVDLGALGLTSDEGFVVIAPDKPARMKQLMEDCMNAALPYYFTPGQQVMNFSGDELERFIQGSAGTVLNAYEMDLLQQKTSKTREEIMAMSPIFIETRGKDPILLTQNGETTEVQTVHTEQEIDPTGCGDAFNAGLFVALAQGESALEGCRKGAVAASFNIEQQGCQEHIFSREAFDKRYGQVYNG